MRLRYGPISPFARKVRVVAHELRIAERIELVPTQLGTPDAAFEAENPLAKIPVLVTDDGMAIPESGVICEYLVATFGGDRLLAPAGNARWRTLTAMSLADGVADACIMARRDLLRPEGRRDDDAAAFQLAKMGRGLDHFEREVAAAPDAPFDLGRIALACSLGYLLLRLGEEKVLATRPALARWYRAVLAHPSMQATDP
ncbi:MAG: glutathione S-transferase family protein [Burkholderiales bacterium]